MDEWRTFEGDGYPDKKATGDYLAIDENGTIFIAYYHDGRMNYPSGEIGLGRMTHWMPLPEPPKPKGPFYPHDTGRIMFQPKSVTMIIDLDSHHAVCAQLNDIWHNCLERQRCASSEHP
jgi:hypothetical protein